MRCGWKCNIKVVCKERGYENVDVIHLAEQQQVFVNTTASYLGEYLARRILHIQDS